VLSKFDLHLDYPGGHHTVDLEIPVVISKVKQPATVSRGDATIAHDHPAALSLSAMISQYFTGGFCGA
jgi:hypothetical protein